MGKFVNVYFCSTVLYNAHVLGTRYTHKEDDEVRHMCTEKYDISVLNARCVLEIEITDLVIIRKRSDVKTSLLRIRVYIFFYVKRDACCHCDAYIAARCLFLRGHVLGGGIFFPRENLCSPVLCRSS